jgi:putative transposase
MRARHKEADYKGVNVTEGQIITVLSEHERGLGTSDACRKHGISAATFYKWKAKFGGLSFPDARKLKTPEGEAARLKRLLADAHVEISVLKDLLEKSWRRPRQGVKRRPG